MFQGNGYGVATCMSPKARGGSVTAITVSAVGTHRIVGIAQPHRLGEAMSGVPRPRRCLTIGRMTPPISAAHDRVLRAQKSKSGSSTGSLWRFSSP